MTLISTQLLFMLAASVTVCRGILVSPPQGGDSDHLLNLSEEDTYTLLKDAIENPDDHQASTEQQLDGYYSLGEKSDDDKRKFSAWAGKRTEVEAIPWGDVLRANGGGEMNRRAFNPWAGKRAFKPWAGKRSSEDKEEDEKRGFKPWAGKRSEVVSEKRGFKPWAGKRSELYDGATELERSEAAPERLADDRLGEYVEKRGPFSPWKGKRDRQSGKRVFNPWAGK